MNNYDVIVVGAGTSGLVSALSLLKEGFKVLLLDDHNNVGGLSNSSKMGRFEFGNNIHNIYFNGYDECYKLENILESLGVKEKVSLSSVSNLFRVITHDKDIVLPFGLENYIKKIEECVPGSEDKVRTFFELALECREALDYIVKNSGSIDYNYIIENYKNFARIGNNSVSKVMDALDIPLEAQELINVMWMLLGNSETKTSFVTYATFLLNVVEGYSVPSFNNADISLSLSNCYLENGGELRLNSKVVKVLVDDNKVNGVRLEDGTILYANKVVVNSSLNNLYGSLIDSSDVPKDALKNINSRQLGGKSFTVNIGLNRSASELGLNDYMYFLYQSLDSDIEYNRMRELLSGNQIAIVHNNANSDISPEGTCEISLTTVYFEDCFGDYVEKERYFTDIREIAQRLISVFEKYTKVRISNYIEEIEIKTPLNTIFSCNSPEGTTYGYKLCDLDDTLPRLLNRHKEKYIDGLYNCGGFDGDAYGYNSSFMSGIFCKDEIMKDIKESKNER